MHSAGPVQANQLVHQRRHQPRIGQASATSLDLDHEVVERRASIWPLALHMRRVAVMASPHDTHEDLLAAARGTVNLSKSDRPAVVPTVFQPVQTAAVFGPDEEPGTRVAGWSLTTKLLIIGGWVLIVLQGALLFQAVGLMNRVVSGVEHEEMYRWHPAPLSAPPLADLLDEVAFAALLGDFEEDRHRALIRLRAHALVEHGRDREDFIAGRRIFEAFESDTVLWRVEDRIAYAEAALQTGWLTLARRQIDQARKMMAAQSASRFGHGSLDRRRVAAEQASRWDERLRQVELGLILALQ